MYKGELCKDFGYTRRFGVCGIGSEVHKMWFGGSWVDGTGYQNATI